MRTLAIKKRPLPKFKRQIKQLNLGNKWQIGNNPLSFQIRNLVSKRQDMAASLILCFFDYPLWPSDRQFEHTLQRNTVKDPETRFQFETRNSYPVNTFEVPT